MPSWLRLRETPAPRSEGATHGRATTGRDRRRSVHRTASSRDSWRARARHRGHGDRTASPRTFRNHKAVAVPSPDTDRRRVDGDRLARGATRYGEPEYAARRDGAVR